MQLGSPTNEYICGEASNGSNSECLTVVDPILLRDTLTNEI